MATGAERRKLHARLATVLDDPEERAGHLALSAAGSRCPRSRAGRSRRPSRSRGAPDAAATLWEQARRFTPSTAPAKRASAESRPPNVISKRARPNARVRCWRRWSPKRRVVGTRARALTRLAWVRTLGEGFHVSAELFEAALAEVGDDLRLQIETERGLAWCAHQSGNVADGEARARHALELAEQLGETGVLASALADVAFHETVRGRGIAFSTIERALSLESGLGWRPTLGRPGWTHALLLE